MPCSEPKATLNPANAGAKQPVEGLAFVYFLICRNGSYYVGMTEDVRKRINLHNNGFGARQTLQLKEFKLVYFEGPMERRDASKRERQLKKWSRAKKNALVSGDLNSLKTLSKSRE